MTDNPSNDCAETPAPDECKCPKDCTSDCAGCRYNWEMNDKDLGFV